MSDAGYPGATLGMPRSGPGSLAPLGRRVPAVLVDWVLCQLVATGLLHVPWAAKGAQSFVVLGVFALENVLLVATTGSTVGHRLLGLRVLQAGPGLYPVQVALRTALLCLFVPAVIVGKDGRGLHDRLAGTVLARR